MIKRTLLGLSLALAIPAHAAPAPNIVLMLIDDLGWQEMKCYDIDAPSPADTPNMDALAKRGILFRHGYSPAPSCTPSRCAIMSGNHPARAQTTCVAGGKAPEAKPNKKMITPWFRGGMPANEQTIARTLRENGYKTGHAGKWHMGAGPIDQGFDFTTYGGPSSRGVTKSRKNRLQDFATDQPGDPYRLDAEGFPTDSVTEGALKFMETNKDKPFFLYYATWLVHTPIHCRSKALLDKYVQRLGVDPANRKEWPVGVGQKNPFFCAMVETLDHYVGQLVTFLETTDDPRNPGHKLIHNTYIFFSSDNGGVEGSKGEGVSDNAPLDQGKTSPREGGVRVPAFASWRGRIPAGTVVNAPLHVVDWYPTLLSLAGAETRQPLPLDGRDAWATITKGAPSPHEDILINAVPRSGAIRMGDWKLVLNGSVGANDLEEATGKAKGAKKKAAAANTSAETVELFNLAADPGEKNNLAAANPEVVAKLRARLETYTRAAVPPKAEAQAAGFKVPRHITFGALPKTATGKIQKFELRARVRGS